MTISLEITRAPELRKDPLKFIRMLQEAMATASTPSDPAAARAQYLRFQERRRVLKGVCDALQAAGEEWDKRSLPAAGFLVASGTWVQAQKYEVLAPYIAMSTELAFYAAAAVTWYWCRHRAMSDVESARVGLANLGSVD